MKHRCTFCPTGEGVTVDHTPPRSFFPSPPPPNLITVPCCEACRLQDQKTDRLIRNLFTSFIETESHPAVADHLADRRNKSFHDDRSMVPNLVGMMKMAPVRDAAGNVITHAPAFDLADPRVQRFVERVARGTLFAAYEQTFFAAKFEWLLKPGIPEAMLDLAPSEMARRKVGDIFQFLASRWNPPEPCYVVMAFFQKLQIIGKFEP